MNSDPLDGRFSGRNFDTPLLLGNARRNFFGNRTYDSFFALFFADVLSNLGSMFW
jgi:hypothetical protein